MTEGQDQAMLNGSFDGNTISLQTWEDACAESQRWADRARRKAYYRRVRRRAAWIVLWLIVLGIALNVLVVVTGK